MKSTLVFVLTLITHNRFKLYLEPLPPILLKLKKFRQIFLKIKRGGPVNVARKYVSIVPTYVLTYLRHKYALDIYAQDPSKSCRISYLRYLLDIA